MRAALLSDGSSYLSCSVRSTTLWLGTSLSFQQHLFVAVLGLSLVFLARVGFRPAQGGNISGDARGSMTSLSVRVMARKRASPARKSARPAGLSRFLRGKESRARRRVWRLDRSSFELEAESR